MLHEFVSGRVAVWGRLALIAVIDENIRHKMCAGVCDTALELDTKAFISKHIQNRSTDDCPNGRACSIALADTMGNNCLIIPTKPAGTRTVGCPDMMTKLLDAFEHGEDWGFLNTAPLHT